MMLLRCLSVLAFTNLAFGACSAMGASTDPFGNALAKRTLLESEIYGAHLRFRAKCPECYFSLRVGAEEFYFPKQAFFVLKQADEPKRGVAYDCMIDEKDAEDGAFIVPSANEDGVFCYLLFLNGIQFPSEYQMLRGAVLASHFFGDKCFTKAVFDAIRGSNLWQGVIVSLDKRRDLIRALMLDAAEPSDLIAIEDTLVNKFPKDARDFLAEDQAFRGRYWDLDRKLSVSLERHVRKKAGVRAEGEAIKSRIVDGTKDLIEQALEKMSDHEPTVILTTSPRLRSGGILFQLGRGEFVPIAVCFAKWQQYLAEFEKGDYAELMIPNSFAESIRYDEDLYVGTNVVWELHHKGYTIAIERLATDQFRFSLVPFEALADSEDASARAIWHAGEAVPSFPEGLLR